MHQQLQMGIVHANPPMRWFNTLNGRRCVRAGRQRPARERGSSEPRAEQKKEDGDDSAGHGGISHHCNSCLCWASRAMTDAAPQIQHVLKTERLGLRNFTPQDAEFILALLNSPGWIEHIGDRNVRTASQAAAWIAERLMPHYASHGYGFWAVDLLSQGHPIGLCGLIHREGLPSPDLGYALLPEFEGFGYAREAARACLAYAFDALRMRTVLAITSAGNSASVRLLLDLGMKEQAEITLPGETTPLRCFGAFHA
jgi:RimJ/RimL family protein N-acetyltransferase